MKDYIDIFSIYLAEEKKSSENTIESYLRDISQFATYCASSRVKDLAEVNTEFLHRYLEYLSVMGKSDSTKSRIVASIRCYTVVFCPRVLLL